jgi:hypothetical protein
MLSQILPILFTVVGTIPTGGALAKRKRPAAVLPTPDKLPDINEVLTAAGLDHHASNGCIRLDTGRCF